jgi:SAM-dependent methyltransferase
MTTDPALVNAQVWRDLYRCGRGDLRYPNDVLVRLGARMLDARRDRKLLDFGCGTGANLAHFASQGFEVVGVDVSEHALARARARVAAMNQPPELRLVEPGQPLPFADGRFDAAYAWQVLYYNDLDGWRASVAELERVCKRGALILVATAAPGDVSQTDSTPLEELTYRLSSTSGQEGCIVTIPDRDALPQFFPGRDLEIGEFGFKFRGTSARHWIVTYRTKIHD